MNPDEPTPAADPGEAVPGELEFDFVKGQFFRVIHVDGCWGGLNAHLDIRMTVFNERTPIPRRIYHTATPEGGLGPELTAKREGRRGVLRECEAELVMSPDIARSLAQWLLEKVAQAEQIARQLRHQHGSGRVGTGETRSE